MNNFSLYYGTHNSLSEYLCLESMIQSKGLSVLLLLSLLLFFFGCREKFREKLLNLIRKMLYLPWLVAGVACERGNKYLNGKGDTGC